MADVPSNLIPVSITDLEPIPVASENALIPVSYGGVSYQVRAGDLLQVTGVLPSRQVNTDAPLTGGGALSSNLNLSIAPGGITWDYLAPTGVASGVYGDASNVPVLTINNQGQITAASSVPVEGGGGAGGDVVGPNSSTAGEIPVYGDATGKLIGNSSAKITTSPIYPGTSVLENSIIAVENAAVQAAFYTYDEFDNPILQNIAIGLAGETSAQHQIAMFDSTFSGNVLSNITSSVSRYSDTQNTAATFLVEACNNASERANILVEVQKLDDGNASTSIISSNDLGVYVGTLPSYIMSFAESGAIGVNGTYGTPGQVLTSAGDSTIATWSDPQITVSATAPGSPVVKQLWLDTTVPTLKYWNGSSWISV